jgi:anti-sigma factor RsiW
VTCEFSGTTVHGYLDGELDAVRAAEFERHIEGCKECQTVLEQIESLRSQLRQNDLYEHAPLHLEKQIRKQLSLNNAARPEPAMWWRRWFVAPAFALAAVVAVFWLALLLVQPHTRSAQVTAELIDAHVRSLQPGHLTDVISTDQHTVKPWFDGKVNFIPPVADYSDKGFTLTGGRLDVVDGHNVAVLVYARAKHVVNLFVWPTRTAAPVSDSSGSREGYNWILWHSGDMTFCLVSDTAPASLAQLKDLIHP